MRVELLGDSALLLVFGEGIDPAVNDRVHELAHRLRRGPLPGILGVVPAYASLAVHFDPLRWDPEALEAELRGLAQAGDAPEAPRTLVLPVRYGGEWGPDLADVAAHCGFTEAEVIARHTAATYRVFFLGFAPGFPYLGGLDPALATPRRAEPRLRVPRGSVGIAGPQTGVYPLETPGGWRIIGCTPAVLFDPQREEPCLLRAGDLLKFEEVP